MKSEDRREVALTKRQLARVEKIELVRTARDEGQQDVGYTSRPFTLTSLPIRRPSKGQLIHERRNGNFRLQVVGHPEYGLPWGVDRLVILWTATAAVRQKSRIIRFRSGADILREFGLPLDGRTYRRLVDSFKRVFGAQVFFGTDGKAARANVFNTAKFSFFDSIRLWCTPHDLEATTLPGDFENEIQLSETFWKELQAHPLPVDMNMVRAFKNSPGLLDFSLWLTWRCWKARGTESIPLFGVGGLVHQLGVEGYESERKFRQTLKRWLASIRATWPSCPAVISADGERLELSHAKAIKAPKSST